MFRGGFYQQRNNPLEIDMVQAKIGSHFTILSTGKEKGTTSAQATQNAVPSILCINKLDAACKYGQFLCFPAHV